MRQFISGSCTAFADLEEKAKRSCVRFVEQEMPPGTFPSRADIGFEIAETTGVARLLVERGLIYHGRPSSEVGAWIQDGERSFENFAALRSWLSTTLKAAFEPTSQTLPARLATSGPDSEGRSDLELDGREPEALSTTAPQRPGNE